MSRQQCKCGKIFGLIHRAGRWWCSGCLWVEILKLRDVNAAMVKQFSDVERQHREWNVKIEDLTARIKQLEQHTACLGIAIETPFDPQAR